MGLPPRVAARRQGAHNRLIGGSHGRRHDGRDVAVDTSIGSAELTELLWDRASRQPSPGAGEQTFLVDADHPAHPQ